MKTQKLILVFTLFAFGLGACDERPNIHPKVLASLTQLENHMDEVGAGSSDKAFFP